MLHTNSCPRDPEPPHRLLRTRRTRQRTREAAGGASGAQTRPSGGASSVPQLPAALFAVSAGALADQRRRVVTPESVRKNLGVHDGNGARELVPVDETGGRLSREDAVRVCDCGRVEALAQLEVVLGAIDAPAESSEVGGSDIEARRGEGRTRLLGLVDATGEEAHDERRKHLAPALLRDQ